MNQSIKVDQCQLRLRAARWLIDCHVLSLTDSYHGDCRRQNPTGSNKTKQGVSSDLTIRLAPRANCLISSATSTVFRPMLPHPQAGSSSSSSSSMCVWVHIIILLMREAGSVCTLTESGVRQRQNGQLVEHLWNTNACSHWLTRPDRSNTQKLKRDRFFFIETGKTDAVLAHPPSFPTFFFCLKTTTITE